MRLDIKLRHSDYTFSLDILIIHSDYTFRLYNKIRLEPFFIFIIKIFCNDIDNTIEMITKL